MIVKLKSNQRIYQNIIAFKSYPHVYYIIKKGDRIKVIGKDDEVIILFK